METVTHFKCYKFKRNLLLIDMILNVGSDEIDWSHISVPEEGVSPSNWQVPYMEQYLSLDGTEKICEVYSEPSPAVNPCRIAFFIYFYKTSKPVLQTPYGDFGLHPEKLPKPLKKLIKFEKPD